MSGGLYLSGRTVIASPCPMLRLPPAPAGSIPDAVISFGPLPLPEARCIGEKPHFRAFEDQSCQLRSPGGAGFYLSQGTHIRVDIPPAANRGEALEWLEGPALTLLHHQRGDLPLHAAAVLVNGLALGFAGDSGAGKSTTVRALVQRGHEFLRDDRLIFHSDDRHVSPGPARLLLKQDAAFWFGDADAGRENLRTANDKIIVMPPRAEVLPLPLAAIILLPVEEAAVWQVEQVAPARALPLLHRQVSRVRLAGLMGRSQHLFRQLSSLARDVPVFRIRGVRQLNSLPGLAECLEELVSRLKRGGA
jgi:hypothetical protein